MNSELFASLPPTKLFFRCAVPAVITSVFGALYSVVDGVFVGKYLGEDALAAIRTCPHRGNVRIIRHNFVGGKAKIRRRAVALQGFLTKSPAKFDEKTCMNPYVDRFLYSL